MTLDYEKFKAQAQEFISISEKLNDAWLIRTLKNKEQEIYLEKRIVKANLETNENNTSPDQDEHIDPNLTTFVYHIVYSQSYSVPVLYFNAHFQNGKSLKLEEVWALVPNCYTTNSTTKWEMITQQEHPKLGIPCFGIHPCHTKDLVLPCSTSNYLITWLSVVGPVVGLSLPLEYAKYT
ncbi:hypothetical protein JTE90_000261 [Oedothorax gibbosus]|uniref:Ubiquitin-like-conjugating enzyme ATG10 n=1 Tax=Oedothorax gibbosus TaxID=931172 RepID=A0AAV6VR97_9ARAC|nr:hypothetical protein JTE90_000261 [Oedothorax gibbosus]